MTKQEIKKYLADVHDLIANDSIDEAIDLLLEFCEVIGKKDLKNDLLLLSGRFTSLERNNTKGILNFDDYTTEKNKVRNDIITIISSFEDEGDDNLETIGRSNGKIIHNTPSKMKLEKYYIASVRIAKDTVDIIKDFHKSENSEVKTLLISPTMSVSLVDITGGSVFDIKFIGEDREQRIHEDSFTEWRFSIKPKEKGVHTIQLCANFIEIYKGEKSYKTAYFESIVTIISEDIPLETNWKDTTIKIVRDEKDMILPPISGQKEESNNADSKNENTSPKNLPNEMKQAEKLKIPKLLIPGFIIAAASAFILYYVNFGRLYDKNAEDDLVFLEDSLDVVTPVIDELHDLKFRLDKDINANFVILNKDTIDNDSWSQFSDNKGKVITIENDFQTKSFDLAMGKASILVLGENGKATGEFKLNLEVDSIYLLKTILRDSSRIHIFNKTIQNTLFNGILIKPDTTYYNKTLAGYSKIYIVKNGNYKISQKHSDFKCTSVDVFIINDTMIKMKCEVLPNYFECSIRLPFENPKVYFNNTEYKSSLVSTANIFNAKGWIYSQKVKEGKYELKVIDPKDEYICEPKNFSITKDVAIAIKCTKKVRYFNPTLRLQNGGLYSKDKITIVLGNNKIDVKPNIDKKDLLFSLSNIEEGTYDLLIDIKRSNKSVLNCSQQDLYINSNKEYIVKGCIEVAQSVSANIFDVSMRLRNGKKYANDNISILLDGKNISAGARYEKNDLILEIKNLKKGTHKISINVIRKKITVLNCINQQIIAGDKKEYIFEGCKEK